MPEVTVGPASGYLAVPAESRGPWPGVVVIHESWGLNGDIRAHADRLAAEGYLALAPDLYRGKSFVRCLRDVFRQLHAGSGSAFDTIDQARAALAARPDATGRTGVLGFCMGGGFALLCAPGGVLGGVGQLRRGPGRYGAGTGRRLPDRGQLRRQGPDGRRAAASAGRRPDRAEHPS